jgi:crotonobetainyl-CoA:carnitine CoA-transferase CaiB-like acyl-CoA transferase
LRPLDGIRVVSLEHALAGPLCTRLLGDLGAEVIKVERPGEGDFARGYDSFVLGNSAFFVWLTRGKKSIALDAKHKHADDILRRLADSADVLVQNLAPGAAARLGLSYEALKQRNPDIIVVDISGYGESGPYAQKKAYDMLIQAESGLISITGTPETPVRVGVSAADLATGMFAQSGALAALVRRFRSGEGANVKIAMLDALAEWMHYPMYRWIYGDSPVPRLPTNHPAITPYGAHKTKDGAVIFSIQNEREWLSFCTSVMGESSLATDPRYDTNSARRERAAEVTALIEARFADMVSAEVVTLLDSAGIANGRLNEARDLWEHQQLAARDRWRDVEVPGGTIRALLPPVTFTDVEAAMGPVPLLGGDTDAVLAELGYSASEIAAFHAEGAVAGPGA